MIPGSVDLVHVLPPPCGGIPMHLKRMFERLRRQGVDCRSYLHPRWHSPTAPRPDGIEMMPQSTWKFPYTWKWLGRYGFLKPKSITHFHDGFEWSSVVYAMRRLRRPTVMTIHSITSRQMIPECSPYDQLAAKWIVRDRGIRWIAVSEEAKRGLVSLGVSAGMISVIPAYLPPVVEGFTPALPAPLATFAAKHRPLLATYGFMLLRDSSGGDAYGFDLCCQALARLKKSHPAAGLVLLIPKFSPENEAQRLRALIRRLGLEKSVLVWAEPLPEAWPLWQKSDVYLRPSTIDGDALAIREALHVGTPVVTSDAVARPSGVLLHRNRDLADFLGTVNLALQKGKLPTTANGEGEVFFEKILQVYRCALADERWNRVPNQKRASASTPRAHEALS